MNIGITERGDAALHYAWYDKLGSVDGVILITKNADKHFRDTVQAIYQGGYKNIVVHFTCTGWGDTKVEPNVPHFVTQLENLQAMVDGGFPRENCVLRVDPIIGTKSGIKVAHRTIERANEMGLLGNGIRCRFSIMDEYEHVKRRFCAEFGSSCYGGYQPSPAVFREIEKMLGSFPDITFETCAEPNLNGSNIIHTGCISSRELELFGLTETTAGVNPQNRFGCLCLNCKKELLSNRHPCLHGCLYCYWKD